jgi:hypothetical protein
MGRGARALPRYGHRSCRLALGWRSGASQAGRRRCHETRPWTASPSAEIHAQLAGAVADRPGYSGAYMTLGSADVAPTACAPSHMCLTRIPETAAKGWQTDLRRSCGRVSVAPGLEGTGPPATRRSAASFTDDTRVHVELAMIATRGRPGLILRCYDACRGRQAGALPGEPAGPRAGSSAPDPGPHPLLPRHAHDRSRPDHRAAPPGHRDLTRRRSSRTPRGVTRRGRPCDPRRCVILRPYRGVSSASMVRPNTWR